jgi:hypothetical protein
MTYWLTATILRETEWLLDVSRKGAKTNTRRKEKREMAASHPR